MKDFTKYNILQVIGKNIKRIRISRGFTQENLASQLQKSINFVSLIERGESGISIPTIIDICKALEVDANSIFDGIIASTDTHEDSIITKSLAIFGDADKAIVSNLISYIIDSKT